MKKDQLRKEALIYHAKPRPGKMETIPTKRYATQRDLSLAYSPGVAEPCLEIEKDRNNAYKYTSKGNLVAVISNGTAVLGLGDIGPLASKPVMEGKGLLFKIFAGIDVFDIEVDASDPDSFVETVKNIAPTFGGINLEDIGAPEAFEIERRLKEELDIPVMHDDQHGTAIISGAAFINALEIANKKIEDVIIVVSGAGSAAISCMNLYVQLGAQLDNIYMFDSSGLLTNDRDDIDPSQAKFASEARFETLADAMKEADAFLGLSVGNIVNAAMIKSMAKDPIVFAMANPDPEVPYDVAVNAREDIIMATGRSDHPNQVNNVLGFPFIFRGALDVRATAINEAMKMAAVKALSELAKEAVPEEVNIAYGKTRMTFGKDYIIPKPFDPRLITTIPPAVAKAAMESGVAQEPIANWDRYHSELLERLGQDNKIIRLLLDRARLDPKRIVFAESDHINVLKAAQIVHDEGMGIPVLLGNREVILELKKEIDFDAEVEIIDPKSKEQKGQVDKYGEVYWKSRKRKGVTLYDAQRLLRQRDYFAAMMVQQGDADGMISGYSRSYPSVVKPVLEVIGAAKGVQKVAATNLMITSRGPLFISDTSINIDPTAKELAKIAQMTATTVKMFGLEPVVAMTSYSNFGSSTHPKAAKVREAVAFLHRYYPDLIVDGEVQVDFALNQEMFKDKFPFSKLSGRKVNTLVFSNIDSANITYKMIKELEKAENIGPIMLGMSKPVHVLQLGASVDEIVNMAAVTVIDAQKKEKYGMEHLEK